MWYLWRMTMREWIVEVYEVAEHWTFEVRIKALTAADARTLAKSYYGKGHSIKGVYRGSI